MRSLRLLLATETKALRWLIVRVLCDDQPFFVVGSGYLDFDAGKPENLDYRPLLIPGFPNAMPARGVQ